MSRGARQADPGLRERLKRQVLRRFLPRLWQRQLLALSVLLVGLHGSAHAAGQVVLYASATTRAFLPSLKGRQETILRPWQDLLARERLAYREASRPAELAGLGADDVLILPSAVALDAAERQALLRARDAGAHLLVTWSAGSRDAAGRWVGHDFLHQLTGFTVTGELEAGSKRRFVVPYGDTAVNQQVPAGRRIWAGELAERPLRLRGGQEAAAYLDWARTTLRAGDHDAAIVFDDGPDRRGRRVLFGYAETSWSFSPVDYQALAAQALDWLRRQPRAWIAAWPEGRRAAQLIEMDTEEGFANAIHFAELMERIDAVGTFYCLTSEARRHPEMVQRLATRHEISFHGEVHFGFRGQTRENQQRRLERMLAEMGEILGQRDNWPSGAGRGFRAPTESYDATTESLLVELGLGHHAAEPDRSDDRLPILVQPAAPKTAVHGPDGGPPSLVVLPRGQLDDLNYMDMKVGASDIGDAVIAEYELNQRMGGLGLLSVHSQNFADPDTWLGRPRHTPLMTIALESLVRHVELRRDRAWIAPGDRIAQWWRDRSRAKLLSRPTPGGLELDITVDGHRPLEGLTVLLPLRHRAADARLLAQSGPSADKAQLRRPGPFTNLLVLPRLEPGRHRISLSLP